MEYKQIKPRKIYEEVTEALLKSIKNGDLKPGDQLESVQQLAENFKVSRSAVREALSALRVMGLIEMKQGEGTFVREFDPIMITTTLSAATLTKQEDIINLLEVRKILETGAAFTAALHRTEKDLIAMENALSNMEKGLHDEDKGEKADIAFHLAIASATQNPILARIMNNVSGLMTETIRDTRKLWLYNKQTTIDRLYHEHVQIYEAIKNQEAEKASQIMHDHLQNVEIALKRYIEATNQKNYSDSK